jgi:hypothetical protein
MQDENVNPKEEIEECAWVVKGIGEGDEGVGMVAKRRGSTKEGEQGNNVTNALFHHGRSLPFNSFTATSSSLPLFHRYIATSYPLCLCLLLHLSLFFLLLHPSLFFIPKVIDFSSKSGLS